MELKLANSIRFSNKNKLKPILQTENSECGIACIVMIANYYGHDISLNYIRKNYSVSLKGARLNDLINMSDSLGFRCKALRLELDEIKNLQSPCILHWNFNHFVVLKKVDSKFITIIDPEIGLKRLTIKEASNHFTGVALELTPASNFEKQQQKEKLKLFDFWDSISSSKSILAQIFSLSLILQLFSLASPFYMQLAIDDVVVSGNEQLLIILALGFSLILIISIATELLRNFILIRIGTQLSVNIGEKLFSHLIRLPIDYFNKRHLGDVISRYSSSDNIFNFLTQGVVAIFIDGILMFGTAIMIIIYSPKLFFVVMAFIILYIIIRFISFSMLKIKIEESISKNAKESSIFMESLRGIQTIKLFGQENARTRFWGNQFVEAINSELIVDKLNIWFGFINSLIFGIENIIIVYLSIRLVLIEELSVGMVIAFMSYKSNFSQRILSLVEQIINYKILSIHVDRLSDIVLEKTEYSDDQFKKTANINVGSIEISNLEYSYGVNEENVLSDVNFSIEKGKSLAIIGPSGCGKSTLIKIIIGLMEPTKGKVEIDGLNIKNVQKIDLRKYFGTVMQEDILFAGSIEDNISFFDQNADKEKILKCSKDVGIYEDIMKMPMQFNTLVGDMGSALSGGQKQRLILARALYKDPFFLVLDEATSNLDIHNEKHINNVLSSMNITRIFVAHRPQTIDLADNVFCMKENKMIR